MIVSRDLSYIKNGKCTQQILYKSSIWRVWMEEPNSGLLSSRFLDDLMEPAYKPKNTRGVIDKKIRMKLYEVAARRRMQCTTALQL